MISLFQKWVAQWKDGAVDWDELEAVLIQSDLGVPLSMHILEKLRKQPLSARTIQEATEKELLTLWPEPVRDLVIKSNEMTVWLVIGVNGTGKTTTIAKLAALHKKEGKKVFLIAADTFRAAALEQLRIWSERLGIGIFMGREGGDPSAAIYEGIQAARTAGAELVLIDTAGRLHNKENLMRELEKMKRVLQKHDASYPHETLLILDGTSGLNTVAQAKEFHQGLNVSGVIVTKLDSSAKGGVIAALKSELKLDTFFVGKGEKIDDLCVFDPEGYIQKFFGISQETYLQRSQLESKPCSSEESVVSFQEMNQPTQIIESKSGQTPFKKKVLGWFGW